MQKIILSVAAIFLMTGCSMNNKNQASEDDAKNHITKVNNSTIQEADRDTGQQTADRLTDLATSIPEVNDATAVVLGKYAIVGIDIDQDIERSQVGSIKYSVGETLKNDPKGASALIVADPDLNERIREVAKDIKDGKPIRGILNELADITSRVIPEVPGDILTPTPSKSIDKEKNQLNDNQEKQELDKEQNDQSNDHIE
ncbi:YhcN/YlaJ family sporulation lipoprotein [Peribacillus muralis]|uniref:YhcN/YlaJ family sporulation lipoprotein n=1 Tax=Peribacillus muralis TaxID=264697 RepID=UPI001F4E275A|nr:YhcN/YlaJ family sporulation lipoprotein [Peribacillus muralis]MCK1992614.1 YhcN/YlaJ family sporulation lipoprotein [Peribacillus muralis]MCK2013170.1 YhcN/YlaJ family sporulation lipoprotein [Peribacillus muralis]